MEVNNGKEFGSMREIEKQSHSKVMNLSRGEVNVKTTRFKLTLM